VRGGRVRADPGSVVLQSYLKPPSSQGSVLLVPYPTHRSSQISTRFSKLNSEDDALSLSSLALPAAIVYWSALTRLHHAVVGVPVTKLFLT
jgi:hypothetical protein